MSWLYRSCEFKTFCLDLDTRNFVIFRDEPLNLSSDTTWSSTEMNREHTAVAGGGQIEKWFPNVTKDSDRNFTRIGRYSPQIEYEGAPSAYYRINATMMPFYRHSASYPNPGHLQWDDFLPIYNLLDIFDRENDRLLFAYMRRPNTSDFQEQPIRSFDLIHKFLPSMGKHDYNIEIQKEFSLKLNNPNLLKENETRLVCADYGLTGDGLFSDHGTTKMHGQKKHNYDEPPYNTGRGGVFRRFRNFMMRNLEIPPDTKIARQPYQVIVSMSSSGRKSRRNVHFDEHVESLEKRFGDRVQINRVQLSSMELRPQAELISKCAIYVSTTGGGTATAIFFAERCTLDFILRRPFQT